MSLARGLRCLVLAALFATLCVFTAIVGGLITLAAGLLGLILMPPSESVPESGLSEYRPWILSVLFFAGTTMALAPFADLPPIPAALCLLSPLFGTMVYTVERSVSLRIARGR
jgi:hypothetical protein